MPSEPVKVSQDVATMRDRLQKALIPFYNERYSSSIYGEMRPLMWFRSSGRLWAARYVDLPGCRVRIEAIDMTTGKEHYFWNSHPHTDRLLRQSDIDGMWMYVKQAVSNFGHQLTSDERKLVVKWFLKHPNADARVYGIQMTGTP